MDDFSFGYSNYADPVFPATDPLCTPPPPFITPNLAPAAQEKASQIRRQNRSCDQCRKGKRRCDAVVLRDWSVDGQDAVPQETQDLAAELLYQQTPDPCSYCTKTKKTCTFDWLKSQEPTLKAKVKDLHGNEPGRTFKKPKVHNFAGARHASNSPGKSSLSSPSAGYPTSPSSKETPSVVSSNGPRRDDLSADLPLEDFAIYPNQMSAPSMHDFQVIESHYDHYDHQLSISPLDSSLAPFTPVLVPQMSDDWNPFALNDLSFLHPRPKRLLTCDEETEASESLTTEDPEIRSLEFLFDPSPFSMSERLVLSTNHTLMSESLIKIYHDSMENALSCWLNERTCPYRYKQKLIADNPAHSTQQSLQQAWAEDWPNRIFRRVFALDKMAGKMRSKPLTKSEESSASKALYLVIMAFATQWAQASKRSREEHHASSRDGQRAKDSGALIDGSHSNMDDEPEFDRKLQEVYWREARKALLDCADVESFKVAFANIVFSLVQKPMSHGQQEGFRKGSASTAGMVGENELFADLDERVQSMIDEDGPPIYLEQGVRHAHSLRHKLQQRERQLAKAVGGTGKPLLSDEDRTTVDLIAWLGYMLESLTSAMHQRPLVVSDDDCDVLPESIQALNLSDDETVPEKPGASRLWNDFFFLQERSNRKGESLRYPCTYEQAAAGLTDAAPIKVLLYRKVTLLQTLLSRASQADKVEEAVRDSIHIYDHWKVMYEPFVKDCIVNHDHLHPRIQTWYICVTAHWHLATLLLADVIESIDQAGLGRESYCESRRSSDLVGTLRRHNAHMVSNLARCATPREEGSFQHSKHFHFALNAGALLTEPWTAILIRVFSKAAILLMQEACSSTTLDPNSSPQSHAFDIWHTEQVARRCEDCVRALKYLGKKSDTARLTGDTLAEALYCKTGIWSEFDLGAAMKSGPDWLAEGDVLDDLLVFTGHGVPIGFSGFS